MNKKTKNNSNYMFLIISIFILVMLCLVSVNGLSVVFDYSFNPAVILHTTDDSFDNFYYQDFKVDNYNFAEGDGLSQGFLYVSRKMAEKGSRINISNNYGNVLDRLQVVSFDWFGIGGAQVIAFVYDLGFLYSIDNSTYIYMDFNYTQGGGGNSEKNIFVFLDYSGNCIYHQPNKVTGDQSNIFALWNLCSADNLSMGSSTRCGIRGTKIQGTALPLTWNLSSCNIEEPKFVRYFVHLVSAGVDDKDLIYHYDNLTLSNLNTTENTLPSCDFELINTTQCYFETSDTQNVTVEISLDCTDLEGDTIYYATQKSSYQMTDTFFREDFIIQTSTDCELDYLLFTKANYFTNHSFTSSNLENALWNLRLDDEQQTIHGQPTFDCNGLLTTPEGVNYFGIGLEKTYNANSTTNFFIGFPFNNTYISVVPKQSNGLSIFNITLNQSNNGNLSVYIDSILYSNTEASNFNWETFGNTVDISYFITPSNNKIEIYISIPDSLPVDIQLNKTISNYAQIDYFTRDLGKVSVDEDYWYLARVFVTGRNADIIPTFSTIKPLSIDFNYYMNYDVFVYVSDSIHIPGIYDTYTGKVNIIQDCDLITSEDSLNIRPSTRELFTGLRVIHLTIAETFGALTGNNVDFILVIDLIYAIVCLMCATVIFFVTFRNIALANITFWGLMLFGHLFLYFNNFITYLTVMSLMFSIAVYIVTRLGTGKTHTGGEVE